MMTPLERAVTVGEAAKLLGRHRSSVHRWIGAGRIPARWCQELGIWVVQRPDVLALRAVRHVGGQHLDD